MKTAKRVFVLILALVIVTALGTSASATGIGVIDVNGTTNGQTYQAYRIFDLTYTGTPDNEKAAYTVAAKWSDFFSNGGAAYISNTNIGDALNPITIGEVTKYINITSDNVDEFARAALNHALGNNIAPDAIQTATGTTVEFTGLDLGYYLVYPYGASEIGDGFASVCSLTSTLPNGTVNVKAAYPTIDKEVDDPNVDIGQTVTYTINGTVPDTTGYDAYTYRVADTMSSGLTFNADVADFSVTINSVDITASLSPTYPEGVNGFTLDIDMMDYQVGTGNVSLVGTPVEIKYSAVVNSNAVNGLSGNDNRATLTYGAGSCAYLRSGSNPDRGTGGSGFALHY